MTLTAMAVRADPRTTVGSSKHIILGSGVRSALKGFAPAERLFSLGDPKTDLYLVESGVVAVYEPRLEGHQAFFGFAFPGDIVGMGFLQTHICTARASVETVAHCVPFSAQDCLVTDDPRAQARLADAIEREF